MASEMETAFREFLLDPSYWRPKLDQLSRSPRELALFPRPDLSRPGLETIELRLRGHDGARLRGLFVRPSFQAGETEVDLVASEFLGPEAVDWDRALEEGASILVYERMTPRRLEDRVLDLLRFASAACEMDGVDSSLLVFRTTPDCERADEVRIAERIRDRGWLRGI